MSEALRRALAVGLALVLVLAVMVLPVAAHDDDDDDEATAQAGALEVEARPAIVAVNGLLVVDAEYEVDDADDDEEDEGTGEEGSDSEEGSDGEDSDELDGDDDEEADEESDDYPVAGSEEPAAAMSVTFSVDFGDGSAPETMTVTEEDTDDEEYEAEAVASHRYTAEGVYPVTVTATPSVGQPVSATVDVSVGAGGARLGSTDRIETSMRLSREAFPTDGSAQAVLLARSDAFADALAAGSLTLREDAPVLLTRSAQLPETVIEEIARALGDTGTVYVLGGEAAIAPSVAEALTAMGYEVKRIAGDDRIDTAVQIARFLIAAGVDIDEVLLASATNFPDALAGASFGALAEAPMLLTGRDALDSRVASLLRELGPDVEVLVLGGEAAISPAVVQQVETLGHEVERLSGKNRYATSAAVADALFPGNTAVVIATGATFPDALSGSALAARRNAPVLLVGSEVPAEVRAYLQAHADDIDVVYVLGGTGAVPQPVRAEIQQLLGVGH